MTRSELQNDGTRPAEVARMDESFGMKLVKETTIPDRSWRLGVMTLMALFLVQTGIVAGTACALKLFAA